MSKSGIRIYMPPPKLEIEYTITDMYEEYWEPLVRIFSAFLRENWYEAEDLAQEVFIKVLRFQEITEGGFEIPKIGSLISFLAQQTWAQYMRLRGDVNFRNYDDDPSILFETEICTELVDHINPSDILEMSEKHNGLMEKISELSVLDQKIIDMTFVQNLPPDKVSKRLGLSSANIRMRITRIRRNLGSYEEDKCESTRS